MEGAVGQRAGRTRAIEAIGEKGGPGASDGLAGPSSVRSVRPSRRLVAPGVGDGSACAACLPPASGKAPRPGRASALGRRLLAAGAAAVLAAGLLAGCAPQPQGGSGQPDAPAAEAEGLTPVTVVLDYTPNTNHTGLYVALDQGLYAERGLDVSIVQPPEDGADTLVASGRAQLGVSYQDWMANYLGSDDPLPVTAVAALVQHNTSGLLSRAGEGLTRPAALAGKRYGTLDVATEQAIVRALVEADGGDWDEVALVPANSTDEVTGLRADQFDAIWCFEAWAGQNAKVQDYPVDYFAFRDIDPRFDYYTPVIVANDTFLAEQPDTVRRFLDATARGYLYASEHVDEAADILVEAAPEVDPELARASQEYLADKYVADAPRWGYIDPERWASFYTWMNDQGLTAERLDPEGGFTNDYLPGGE